MTTDQPGSCREFNFPTISEHKSSSRSIFQEAQQGSAVVKPKCYAQVSFMPCFDEGQT